MKNTAYIKNYDAPPVIREEILRYAQVKTPTRQIEDAVEECISEVSEKLIYKVCYIKTDISVCDDTLDFGFMQVRSKSALKNLENCDEAIVFAATVGIELDRAIAKYSALSQAKALILQAIGTERIESLCDLFCKEISTEMAALNKGVKNRFSPGYGDFSIETQRDIFRILKPLNKMGVFLNESLLMSPSKSVTAIIGIYNRDKV